MCGFALPFMVSMVSLRFYLEVIVSRTEFFGGDEVGLFLVLYVFSLIVLGEFYALGFKYFTNFGSYFLILNSFAFD